MSSSLTLIDELLRDQQRLTAVDYFSQRHESASEPVQSRYYRDLIPLSKPGEGEQYAFEVDLDACSGCKACVSACHSLNGLDEGESWRDIGLLLEREDDWGTQQTGTQQTVTTACHHCVDPACANGCPTQAYQKDPETGIVRHLDDQCIGCRYCELKCPYEVPKYNDRLGIVRKCDMCQGRLVQGEAPACVQACPNEAIRIRIVSTSSVIERSTPEAQLLPGTVTSNYTKPTTQYYNHRGTNRSPGDETLLKAGHGHFPLVWMLVLTQMGAGVTLVDWTHRMLQGEAVGWRNLAIGLVFSLAGLAGSILHLGRPLQAWRAFLGWRTSWLSREIMVFGAWSSALIAYFGAVVLSLPSALTLGAGSVAAAAGLAGVFTSVMVYADTRRPLWALPWTTIRFYGTALGAGLLLSPLPWLAALPVAGCLLTDFIGAKRFSKTGGLMRGPLLRTTQFRFTTGVAALLFCPVPLISLGLFLLSELAGRSLFFRAVDEPKMPGGITT